MLLTQFGTNDSSINKEGSGNPSFGKTPEALKQFQDKEGARDNWDRFQLERCIEDMLEGMINLLAENQEKPINFHIFDADVEQINDMFGEDNVNGGKNPPKFMKKQGKSAMLTISKSLIAGKYKFIVDASSTIRQDEDAQMANLTQIMTAYLQNPQLVDQYLQADGLQFHFGKAFKSLVYNSGVNDPDTIISDANDADDDQDQQPQPMDTSSLQDPQFRNIAEQLFNGQQQGQGQQPQQPGQPMDPNQQAMMQQQAQQQAPAAPQKPPKQPFESISFKDALAAGATEAAAKMLEQAGLPSNGIHEQAINNQHQQVMQQLQQAQQAIPQPPQPGSQR